MLGEDFPHIVATREMSVMVKKKKKLLKSCIVTSTKILYLFSFRYSGLLSDIKNSTTIKGKESHNAADLQCNNSWNSGWFATQFIACSFELK